MQTTLRSRWAGRGIRAGIVISILIGLYALAGFLAVPRILRSQLTGYVAEHYHRRLSLGEIHFNPFTLRLDATDISFPDADSSPMVGAAALRIELELASLWRRGPSFREIVLGQPFAHVVVRRNGRLNLADLVPAAQSTGRHAKSAPLRLYIDRLTVIGGRVVYEDRSHPTPFRTELKPIDFALRDFRTVGAAPNQYTLEFDGAQGAHFQGSGVLAAEPFASHGQFSLTGLPVRTLWSYLRDRLHFEVVSGTITLNGAYTLSTAAQSPAITIALPELTLSQLGVRPLNASSNVVQLGVLKVRGTQVDLERHTLSIGSIGLAGGTVQASLGSDGTLNLARLLTGSASSEAARSTAMPTTRRVVAPWRLAIPDVSVTGLKLVGEDHEVTPAAAVTLDDVRLHVHGLRYPGDTPLEISLAAGVDRTGQLAIDGTYFLRSGASSAHVTLDHIDLTPLQPFLAEKSSLALRSGWLTTKLDVSRSAHGALRVTGTTVVGNLRTVDDLLGRDFVKWSRLTLEGLSYRSSPAALRIQRIVAVAPYARVIVTPQHKLSLFEVLTAAHPPAQPPTAAAVASAHPMSISIGRVEVVNGSAHYTDLWIVPHFFLAIQGLDGNVIGLSSDPSSRATVDLKGKVDQYAPISISGTVNPFSALRFTDIRMQFHGVQLTTATPYSARFAGYKIEKGTMSADITYHLENGELSANPHFIIDQLELGQKVDSPDAVHLPLKFAVALLKDRHGVIDLDLPISGRMSDPSFRLGPIILKVVVNLITKAVTSPFALLGKLVGGGGEQLQDIDFKPGSATLDAQARKRLAALAKALEDRPGLKLSVPSDYSPTLDRSALAHQALEDSLLGASREALASRKRRRAAQHGATPNLEDPATRFRLLVGVYRERLGSKAALPASAAMVLKAKGRKTAAAPLEAAITALQSAILASIDIPDRDLDKLARHRAAAIQGALLDGTHLDPGRLFILNTATVPASAAQIRLQLALE